MDERGGCFVNRLEDQRIAPQNHAGSQTAITECKARDPQRLRLRPHPQIQHEQAIYVVAQICKIELPVLAIVVPEPDRQQEHELGCVYLGNELGFRGNCHANG